MTKFDHNYKASFLRISDISTYQWTTSVCICKFYVHALDDLFFFFISSHLFFHHTTYNMEFAYDVAAPPTGIQQILIYSETKVWIMEIFLQCLANLGVVDCNTLQ